MDFRLTEEQQELRNAVRDYLAGEHGPEVLRRRDAQREPDDAVWSGLVGMGLAGLLVPEAQGGLGLGLIEAALVAVELGRANVSEPIADTALIAAPLLSPAEQEKVAAGTLKIALAHPINPWIADLGTADLLYTSGGTTVPPVAKALTGIDPLRSLFAPVFSTEDDNLLNRAALISAAQMLGGAEAMLAISTEYAKTREQFGQAIGSFQAIKHHLATVAVKVEFARPVVLRAAYAAEHGHARTAVAISHAKVAATDAAMLAAETAIQVHGAMGYTYEVDLHFWMKRAWALAGAWGDRAFHLRRIEAAVIGRGMTIGPDTVFASELNNA
ncbi:acyl-CoA dehydrogenase [Sphingomonas paeninsulae]|uniref:Acyl-CoA dehydrogenase n=1 Tax=Sphingomonas paeninsulae TaxID=2319844 RepID=A0A494TMN9_SPHPE|nr:acyl-CoA dehydrogenase family protein [Sphingomonas paeninsulae]AYJ87076.1 acyl-CoA dehydrogenase [Sphingomonas paeninsulae]